ncbi:putative polyamine transporter [Canna indica]|uniref:Polyamine transporter n=1 Tax=Canna indica TaxID=4628 RepID=A0AAQ3KCF8_9LILI|nr:putative polyamine transporter [Canna indica]
MISVAEMRNQNVIVLEEFTIAKRQHLSALRSTEDIIAASKAKRIALFLDVYNETLSPIVDDSDLAFMFKAKMWWDHDYTRGASALSNMSMFITEMSSDSYQLLGMAERGMLPEFFSKRSCYGTPLMGILFSISGVLLLSWMSFQELLLCVLHHDTIMRELHAQGRTIAEIAETLKTAPLPANTIVAIRSAYALG